LIVLDNVFSDKDFKVLIVKNIKDITASENIFITLEESLDKKSLTKFEKYAEKTQKFSLPKSGGRQFGTKRGSRDLKDFNIFSLTDAFGNRDRKKLWVLYRKAMQKNYSAEEMHGLLFWQTKTLLLVAQKSTAGIKPFVVNKARRFLDNWTLDELKELSTKLVNVYHESRRGKFKLEIGLEQLILTL